MTMIPRGSRPPRPEGFRSRARLGLASVQRGRAGLSQRSSRASRSGQVQRHVHGDPRASTRTGEGTHQQQQQHLYFCPSKASNDSGSTLSASPLVDDPIKGPSASHQVVSLSPLQFPLPPAATLPKPAFANLIGSGQHEAKRRPNSEVRATSRRCGGTLWNSQCRGFAAVRLCWLPSPWPSVLMLGPGRGERLVAMRDRRLHVG